MAHIGVWSKLKDWQFEIDKLLKNSQGNDCLKLFGSMQTDDDRCKFILDKKLLGGIGWLKDYFTQIHQPFDAKDANLAAQCKEQGNRLFQAGQDSQALQHYTKSMRFAADNSEHTGERGTDLAVAYGNRSAALLRLHDYQACLTDIERAMEAGVSQKTKPKLLVRQCLCYVKLGQRNKVVEAQKDIQSLHFSSDDKTRSYLEGELGKIETQLKAMGDGVSDTSGSDQKGVQCPATTPSVSYGPNTVLVQASSAVEMKSSPAQGRFLQATRSIKAGDTLIVERPFAAVLLPPHYLTHCQHCFVALPRNPLGCPKCSAVLYCCEKCRDNSWTAYHHVECRHMQLLRSVGIAHLALRIVLTVGLQPLLDFLEEREKKKTKKGKKEEGGSGDTAEAVPGVTEEGHYERNYLSVYDLMTHAEDMDVGDLFQYALTANLLLGVLVHSGWFSSDKNAPTSSDWDGVKNNENMAAFLEGSLFHRPTATTESALNAQQVCGAGGALLRHVQQLVCNAHAITAIVTTETSQRHLVETQNQDRIATAIYPTASLMNHSCHPTILSSFQGDVLIVKSVKDVEEGGEIFNCYGPHYKRMVNRRERREALKAQYFFDCHCEACREEDSRQAILCPKCKGTLFPNDKKPTTCAKCHCDIDMSPIVASLQSADSLFGDGLQLCQDGRYADGVKKLRKCLLLRCKALPPNDKVLGETHDAIAKCLASEGNYAEAANHLAQSVAITEAVFGTGSIEAARERHKAAEVLIHASRFQEALVCAGKALEAARVLCGERDGWVEELVCLKTSLLHIVDANCQ